LPARIASSFRRRSGDSEGGASQDHARSRMKQEVLSSPVPKWSLRPEVLFLLSTIIYFVPLAVGWFVYVDPSGERVATDYHSAVIPVVTLALVSILAVIALLPARSLNVSPIVSTEATKLEGLVLGALLVLSGLYVLLTPELFVPNKGEVLRATGRGHYLFYNLSAIGVLYCVLVGWERHFWFLLLSAAGVYLTLYIGHRSSVAIVIAGLLYIAFRNRSVFSIGFKLGLALVATIVGLIIYKLLSSSIKRGSGAAVDRIISGELDLGTVFGMEPFITFAHLDFVVAENFRLGCSNLWQIPVSLVPFMDRFIDGAACSYHSQVQPVFFSGYDTGVGANIWAEFFANFGYPGIPLLVVIVVALGKALEFALVRLSSAVLRAGIILAVVHFTVYIQRNELLGAFVFAKRAILVALLVFALAWLVRRSGLASARGSAAP